MKQYWDQYYEGMAEVRFALRERGVNVISLQPFLGISNFEQDFERLCAETDSLVFVDNKDILSTPRRRERNLSYFIERIVKKIILLVKN